jgi:nucleoside-diphosphate-sugar epimerase
VVVTGATGNIGTSVVRALSEDSSVGAIRGIARRDAAWTAPKFELHTADTAQDDLVPLLAGADVVIHLAWLFQPTHDPVTTWNANVLGAIRLFEAAAAAGVPRIVYSSSVGAYSPGPKDRAVTEEWPTHGWPGAAYTREKSYLERFLDGFEQRHGDIRVVRIRPGFVFQRDAASEQRRLFAGPFLPGKLVRPGLVPVVPDIPGLRLQTVHSMDLADAFRRAALTEVSGAFNVAADPVVDAAALAELLRARTVPLPVRPVRTAVAAAWRLHAAPASPGLFDAVLRLPIMDTARARQELEWTPRHSSTDAVAEFLTGLRDAAGAPTAPLASRIKGGRLGELWTGVGKRP